MRQAARVLGVLGLATLVGSAPSPGQTRTIQVEGWEVRINERQPPEKVMEAIGVKPGMVVGEVGAGTGRVTVWLADRVGAKGKVYANDIDETALRHLAERCAREGLANVNTIVGTVDDPRLPAGTLDIAFMTNTYHHLEKPVELVRNIRPALKPGGILAIVERDADRSVHKQEATRPEDFVRQMDEAGFEVVSVDKSMSEDNVYIAHPKASSGVRR
jgi:SAM-dependent methyltransferase